MKLKSKTGQMFEIIIILKCTCNKYAYISQKI